MKHQQVREVVLHCHFKKFSKYSKFSSHKPTRLKELTVQWSMPICKSKQNISFTGCKHVQNNRSSFPCFSISSPGLLGSEEKFPKWIFIHYTLNSVSVIQMAYYHPQQNYLPIHNSHTSSSKRQNTMRAPFSRHSLWSIEESSCIFHYNTLIHKNLQYMCFPNIKLPAMGS